MTPRPVALVTGSRKGLGRHLAERLVADGFQVVGCSREPADWTLDGYLHVQADVVDEAQVKALHQQIRDRFERLDVTVNNAGAASMNHSLLTPMATFDRVVDVNFRGTFLVSRESAKLMRAKGRGRIVNLTTVAVPLDLAGEAVYAASKSAVESLTRVMAKELAPFGITVNAVGPTPIATDLIKGVKPEAIAAITARLAIQRQAEATDVYNVVEFFIRPQSDFITGQVLYLGGA